MRLFDDVTTMSLNSVFEVVFNMFCRDNISTMDTQFKDLADPIKL